MYFNSATQFVPNILNRSKFPESNEKFAFLFADFEERKLPKLISTWNRLQNEFHSRVRHIRKGLYSEQKITKFLENVSLRNLLARSRLGWTMSQSFLESQCDLFGATESPVTVSVEIVSSLNLSHLYELLIIEVLKQKCDNTAVAGT